MHKSFIVSNKIPMLALLDIMVFFHIHKVTTFCQCVNSFYFEVRKMTPRENASEACIREHGVSLPSDRLQLL